VDKYETKLHSFGQY